MLASGNCQWSATYPSEAMFTNDIANGHLWVAERDGTVAGVIALTTHQTADYAQADWDLAEPALVPHRLAAYPGAQGRGAARALMQRAEHAARAQGLRVVRADTSSQNVAMQRLFATLDYRFAGEIALTAREGLRFFCYEKRLT